MAGYWLIKTEPGDFSFEDLQRDKRTVWDGVRNALALKHLRAMRKGDQVLLYHSGKVRAAVGLAKVVREAYPDPESDDEKFVVVDLAAGRALQKSVALAEIKAKPLFKHFDLVRISRLSVMPVPAEIWKALLKMGGLS